MTRMQVDVPTLTQDQLDAFERDGFVIVRRLVPRDVIDELAPGYDQAVRGEITEPSWVQRWKPDWILQLPNPYRNIPSWRGHRYMQLVVGVARQLLGQDIDYAYDQLIYKPPHNEVEVL